MQEASNTIAISGALLAKFAFTKKCSDRIPKPFGHGFDYINKNTNL